MPEYTRQAWPQRRSQADSMGRVNDNTANRAPVTAILRAVAFAAHKHRNQRRKDEVASPYINHPIALAELLASVGLEQDTEVLIAADRKSTRLNSSHSQISYAVFCLKKNT